MPIQLSISLSRNLSLLILNIIYNNISKISVCTVLSKLANYSMQSVVMMDFVRIINRGISGNSLK